MGSHTFLTTASCLLISCRPNTIMKQPMLKLRTQHVHKVISKRLWRIEVFTAMTIKNAVFWDVAPWTSRVSRRFGRMYRLHLQSRKIRERGTSVSRWLQTARPNLRISAINCTSVYHYPSIWISSFHHLLSLIGVSSPLPRIRIRCSHWTHIENAVSTCLSAVCFVSEVTEHMSWKLVLRDIH
jgi:hypothetical protein